MYNTQTRVILSRRVNKSFQDFSFNVAMIPSHKTYQVELATTSYNGLDKLIKYMHEEIRKHQQVLGRKKSDKITYLVEIEDLEVQSEVQVYTIFFTVLLPKCWVNHRWQDVCPYFMPPPRTV